MQKIDNTQYAVIGMGRFGLSIAKSLHEAGAEVLALDISQSRVDEILPYCTHAICMDATDEKSLKNAGIKNFDNVIVCIGGAIDASVFITLTCKQLGVPRIIAKACDKRHKTILEKIGADIVVFPEEYMGQKLASMLINPNVVELAELTPEIKIIEVVAPKKWEDKSLRQLDLRSHYGISILLIKRGNSVIASLNADEKILDGDILVLCGQTDNINKISRLLTESVI